MRIKHGLKNPLQLSELSKTLGHVQNFLLKVMVFLMMGENRTVNPPSAPRKPKTDGSEMDLNFYESELSLFFIRPPSVLGD